jgi:hypothetical protein
MFSGKLRNKEMIYMAQVTSLGVQTRKDMSGRFGRNQIGRQLIHDRPNMSSTGGISTIRKIINQTEKAQLKCSMGQKPRHVHSHETQKWCPLLVKVFGRLPWNHLAGTASLMRHLLWENTFRSWKQ